MRILNAHEERVLRAACSRPVREREFTEGATMLQVAPRFVALYFSRLLASQYVYRIGEQFFATEAGRKVISDKDEAMQRMSRSFADDGIYTGPNWHIRTGGEDHKRHPSRGIDAGRAAA